MHRSVFTNVFSIPPPVFSRLHFIGPPCLHNYQVNFISCGSVFLWWRAADVGKGGSRLIFAPSSVVSVVRSSTQRECIKDYTICDASASVLFPSWYPLDSSCSKKSKRWRYAIRQFKIFFPVKMGLTLCLTCSPMDTAHVYARTGVRRWSEWDLERWLVGEIVAPNVVDVDFF